MKNLYPVIPTGNSLLNVDLCSSVLNGLQMKSSTVVSSFGIW